MGLNSLPKTVTRQRRDCDLNPGPPAPESSTLTTRLPSHPIHVCVLIILQPTTVTRETADSGTAAYCGPTIETAITSVAGMWNVWQ